MDVGGRIQGINECYTPEPVWRAVHDTEPFHIDMEDLRATDTKPFGGGWRVVGSARRELQARGHSPDGWEPRDGEALSDWEGGL